MQTGAAKQKTMKLKWTILLLFFSLAVSGQAQKFLIEGRVTDQFGDAIPDVYVVNLNSHDKDISGANGVFSVWVAPSDSLILSHISYFRKKVSVYSLLVNPLVKLISEDVNIPEIQVAAQQRSDQDRARQNMEFLMTYQTAAGKITEGLDPVRDIVTANNRLMKSEAASLTFFSFSPSEQLQKLFLKLKHQDPAVSYASERKTEMPKE